MSWTPPAAVAFDLDGHRYRMSRDGAATAWASAAVRGQWTVLVPNGVVADDRRVLLSRLTDPTDWLDLSHLYCIAMAVAVPVYGTTWPAACRLLAYAEHHWLEFDGWAMARGVDPRALPIQRMVSAVWGWIAEQMQWADADQSNQVRSEVFASADNLSELIEVGIHPPLSMMPTTSASSVSAVTGATTNQDGS